MPLTYTAKMQDDIAMLLTRGLYATLSTAQKVAIDDTWTSGIPDGAAGRALDVLGQYANMFSVVDTAEIPVTWEPWFVSEAVLQASPAFPSSEVTDTRRNNALARRDAIVSFSRQAYSSTTTGDMGALTRAGIRAFVITNAIKAKDSVFIEPAHIDGVIEEVVAEVWNEADWAFKTKFVTLTIAIAGTVTVSDSVIVDKIIGDRIQYDADFGGIAVSVDYPTLLDYKAATVSTGKPVYFHLLRAGDDLTWLWERTIDQIYTAKAMVTEQTPAMTDDASMDAALALFPTDFRSIMKNRILAVCLSHVGVNSVADRLLASTSDKIHGLMSRYDNTGGEPEWSESEHVRPYGMGFSPGMIGGSGV